MLERLRRFLTINSAVSVALTIFSKSAKKKVLLRKVHSDTTKQKKKSCLKITEKVSFNIASEASYVYILSGQKLIKNAKNGQFWRVFENLKLAVKQGYQIGKFY